MTENLITIRKVWGGKESETDILKNVNKTNKSEYDSLDSELKSGKKLSKSQVCKIHNLENIKVNNQDKIRALKVDKDKFKSENVALQKKVKRFEIKKSEMLVRKPSLRKRSPLPQILLNSP